MSYKIEDIEELMAKRISNDFQDTVIKTIIGRKLLLNCRTLETFELRISDNSIPKVLLPYYNDIFNILLLKDNDKAVTVLNRMRTRYEFFGFEDEDEGPFTVYINNFAFKSVDDVYSNKRNLNYERFDVTFLFEFYKNLLVKFKYFLEED